MFTNSFAFVQAYVAEVIRYNADDINLKKQVAKYVHTETSEGETSKAPSQWNLWGWIGKKNISMYQ